MLTKNESTPMTGAEIEPQTQAIFGPIFNAEVLGVWLPDLTRIVVDYDNGLSVEFVPVKITTRLEESGQ